MRKNGLPSAPIDSTRMAGSVSTLSLYPRVSLWRRVALPGVLTRCPPARRVRADLGHAVWLYRNGYQFLKTKVARHVPRIAFQNKKFQNFKISKFEHL